jgi:hypothetical protein
VRAANSPTLAYAKPTPRRLEKLERRAERDAKDRRERQKCHVRSGGRCEVILVTHRPETSEIIQKRCKGRATQNHHLLGGIGRRNIGPSIKAEHRLDTCDDCHAWIEHCIYEPYREDEKLLAATVRYIEVQR